MLNIRRRAGCRRSWWTLSTAFFVQRTRTTISKKIWSPFFTSSNHRGMRIKESGARLQRWFEHIRHAQMTLRERFRGGRVRSKRGSEGRFRVRQRKSAEDRGIEGLRGRSRREFVTDFIFVASWATRSTKADIFLERPWPGHS